MMIHLNTYEANTYQSLTLADPAELRDYLNRYPVLWIKASEPSSELARLLDLDMRLLTTKTAGMFAHEHTAVVVVPERTTMIITPRFVLTIGQHIDLPPDVIPTSAAHLVMLLLSAVTDELAEQADVLQKDLLKLRESIPGPAEILMLWDRVRKTLAVTQQVTDDFAAHRTHPLFENVALDATLFLQKMRSISYQLTVLNYWQVDDLWKLAQSQPAPSGTGFTRNDMIFAGLFILAIVIAALT
jgi:hypothetical protein